MISIYSTTNFKFLTFGAISISLFIQGVSSDSKGVSYKYMGNDWTDLCATGTRQSPIDIPTDVVGRIFVEDTHVVTPTKAGITGDKTTSSSGHRRRFMASSEPSHSTTAPTKNITLTISAPTFVTAPCAVSTTSETCSQAGMCCALANRTNGNT